MQEEINKQVDELLAKGCIEPSNSPHSAPIVMVKKKTGKWRLCVDFRQLNNRSVKDAYPLPRVQHILDQLREAHYITSLDLKDGYWKIPMEKVSRPLTAFTVPGRGLFQWKVMPFGLHSAPATFQRALDRVIGPEMLPHAFAYLDDIIVIGKTLEEHKNNVKEVFRRLRAANLRINVDKCDFFKKELKYLGHKVTEHGICTDPEKVAAISQLKPPTNVKELRQYLGVAPWYRRFVPDFANTVHPLGGFLKKGVKWVWSEEHQQAFEKTQLPNEPMLTHAAQYQQTQVCERSRKMASRRNLVADAEKGVTNRAWIASSSGSQFWQPQIWLLAILSRGGGVATQLKLSL
ncbi:hypothetical protein ACLKA6_017602 [Drosophila palustris]